MTPENPNNNLSALLIRLLAMSQEEVSQFCSELRENSEVKSEYYSPELFWGGASGPPADVYTLGLALYEEQTGVLPFIEQNSDAPYRAAALGRRMKGETVPATDSSVHPAIYRALSFKTEERLESPTVLFGVLTGEIPMPPMPQPKPAPRPVVAAANGEGAQKPKFHVDTDGKAYSEEDKKSSKIWFIVLGIAAAIAIIAFFALRYFSPWSGPEASPTPDPAAITTAVPSTDPSPEGSKKPGAEATATTGESPEPSAEVDPDETPLPSGDSNPSASADPSPDVSPSAGVSPSPAVTGSGGSTTTTPKTTPKPSPKPTPKPTPSPTPSPSPSPSPSSDSKYEVFLQDCSWEQAKTYCEEKGGHLAVITNETEFNEVVSIASSSGATYIWLGAKRDDSGNWAWVNGATVDYYPWDKGEPSYRDWDGTYENYLMIWKVNFTGTYSWRYNDVRNNPVGYAPGYYSGRTAYICQYD